MSHYLTMFSLNTGQHTKYPANDDGTTFRPCDKYDPRKRYWYIHLTEEVGITYRFFHDDENTNHDQLIYYWIARLKKDCEGVGNNTVKQCFIKKYNCSDVVNNDSLTDDIYVNCPTDIQNGKNLKFMESRNRDFGIYLNGKNLLENIYDKDFEYIYQTVKSKIVRTKTSDAFSYSQEYQPNVYLVLFFHILRSFTK